MALTSRMSESVLGNAGMRRVLAGQAVMPANGRVIVLRGFEVRQRVKAACSEMFAFEVRAL